MLLQTNPETVSNERVESWEVKWGPCSRLIGRSDYNNWYALHNDQTFIVCPGCFETSIRGTHYDKFFKLLPRIEGIQSCSFADYFIPLAWYGILRKHDEDLSTFQAISDKSSLEGGCPNLEAQKLGSNRAINYQKTPKTGYWYTIKQPKTGELMTNFTICSSCAAKFEIILQRYSSWIPSPELRNEFVLASPMPCEATCDFISGRRMIDYVCSVWDNISGDFTLLAALIAKRAHLPECREGLTMYGKYFVLRNAKRFTACEECMEDLIKPDIERGVVSSESFEYYDAVKTGFVCSLKVPRVQKLWAQAMNSGRDGFALLERESMESDQLVVAIQELFAQIQLLFVQANSLQHSALLQNQMEGTHMLAATIAGGSYIVSASLFLRI